MVVAIPEHLLRQIIIDRDDHELYLVLADVLSAHGDPRGELIVLAVRLAADPADPDVQARHDELLARMRTDFEQVAWTTEAPSWHLGFVDRLTLTNPGFASLRAALAHPSAQLLRSLVLQLDGLFREVLDVLCEAPRPGLRNLYVSARRMLQPGQGGPCDWSMLDDLDELQLAGIDLVAGVRHTYLRRLVLAADPISSPEWFVPNLRELVWTLFRDVPPSVDQLREIGRELPRALHFVARIDDDDERCDVLRALPCRVEFQSQRRSR